MCDMIGHIRDLRAESGVENIVGLPHKLWHYSPNNPVAGM
jgi:hypothetical protein